MTTGNFQFGPNIDTGLFYTFGFYRLWNGADGKYEQFGGFSRRKWNPYYLQYGRRRRDRNYFNYVYGNSESDPDPKQGTVLVHVAFPYTAFAFPDNLQLKLLNKLSSKVRDHDFNLAVNLGQLGEVSRMVASNLGKLGRSILALKRGDFSTAARQLGSRPRGTRLKSKDISGRWLELQYGWQPLLSDSYEAAKAFEALSRGPRRIRHRAELGYDRVFEMSLHPTLYSQLGTVSASRQITYEAYEEMSIARSLGLTNPLSVAWELVPFSFVVDWFIPIGDYVDALFLIPSLKGRFMTTDSNLWRQKGEMTGVPSSGPWASNWIFSRDSLPTGYFEAFSSNRYVTTSLDVPRPNFDFRGAIHGKRIWNAISLAHQRFAS